MYTLIIWNFPQYIESRTKCPCGPHVWDPCSKQTKHMKALSCPWPAVTQKL